MFWIAGSPYFSLFHIPDGPAIIKEGIAFAWAFIIFSYIGHLALLIALPLLLIIGLCILFAPNRQFLSIAGALLAASLVVLLWTDAYLYRVYHFHFNGIFLQFFLHGGEEIFGLSSHEYLILFGALTGLFLLEYLLAILCWQKLRVHKSPYFSVFLSLPPVALFLSYALFFMSASALPTENIGILNNTHALIIQAPVLPLYNNALAKLLPTLSLEDISRSGEGLFMQQAQITHPLNYPQHPLIFAPPATPPNIVIIGLDAWRFDMMTPEVTPHIYAFSKRCQQFLNHYSGGNSTEPGLFSLFYSIPSSYWSAALNEEQGPLLFHELIKQHYAMGMFISAETYNPPYNKTLYSEIKGMPTSTPGDQPYQRDAYITQSFQKFIRNRDAHQPFFSFVFYNTSHSYCKEANYEKVFNPAVQDCNRLQLSSDFDPLPYKNRYKNAVHYVDSLVGQVLNTLAKEKLLDNTIVIILGDHGEEFNDNQHDYWGHASNFTRYQLQTPLLIAWPGKAPKKFTHRTSHFDVVPTLFKQVFHCKNPTQDYSIGTNLYDSTQRPYLVVGSYIDFGIVEQNRITRILPGGNFEVLDPTHSPLNVQPPMDVIKLAFADTTRWFVNPGPMD